jgi:hypothetical protein
VTILRNRCVSGQWVLKQYLCGKGSFSQIWKPSPSSCKYRSKLIEILRTRAVAAQKRSLRYTGDLGLHRSKRKADSQGPQTWSVLGLRHANHYCHKLHSDICRACAVHREETWNCHYRSSDYANRMRLASRHSSRTDMWLIVDNTLPHQRLTESRVTLSLRLPSLTMMRNFWALPAVLRIALASSHSFSVFDDLLAFPQVCMVAIRRDCLVLTDIV